MLNNLEGKKESVNVNKLIETFTDMSERGTLLAGARKEDLLMQIVGTIVKVAMES